MYTRIHFQLYVYAKRKMASCWRSSGETHGTEFYDGAFVLLQTHRRPNSAIIKGRLDT
jgi:hypothetical protein